MATPSVKELQLKLTKIIEEKNILQKEVISLKDTITCNNSEISKLNKTINIERTDEDTTKKILSLFAQGHQYSVILDKLRFNSYDVDIETIKDTCLNIDSIEPSMQLYYKQQVESYEEGIKINPETLKDGLAKKYQFLYNEASLDLTKVVEIEERRKIREEMNKHLDKLNNVLKNIVDDNKELPENEFLSKIAGKLMSGNSMSDNDESYSKKESIETYEVM